MKGSHWRKPRQFYWLFAGFLLLSSLNFSSFLQAQAAENFTLALSLQPGQSVKLAALGITEPVLWKVKEGTVAGVISKDGVFTASMTPGTYHILAALNSMPDKFTVFTILVTPVAAETEPPLGTERPYLLPGGGAIRMQYIPSGAFMMGSSGRGDDELYAADDEKPVHNVTLKGFWIGKTEITRGQYRLFMKAGGYTKQELWSPAGWTWRVEMERTQPDWWESEVEYMFPPGPFKQSEDHPVVGVNFHEAEAFCRWAGLRLPTEAEWEKAARWDGKISRIYPWGDLWNHDFNNNANDTLYPGGQSSPIGRFPQGTSASRCVDMVGNVWEWCSDWLDPNYYAVSPKENPTGPAEGDVRIIKGGSWFGSNFVGADEEDRLRAAQRQGYDPMNSNERIGFRCVAVYIPEPAGR